MKSADVVIGAGFGDEGKGLLTDYYADKAGPGTVVCRFNGGAQAGHTVVTSDNIRHVFAHFGSGTLVGAPTYLSQFFIVNPLLWLKERDVLFTKLKALPTMYVHPLAMLTTPYDMILNQLLEKARGGLRHGSCGVGINETVTRSLFDNGWFNIPSSRCNYPHLLRRKLAEIKADWVPRRINELGLEITDGQKEILDSEEIVEQYIAAATQLNSMVIWDTGASIEDAEHVVFEGAQGLLLDEKHEFFPHVTRSRTGMHNVAILARDAGIRDLTVTYATRAYTTRHGSGPLPHRDYNLKYFDDTNAPNDWQGTLRFAPLDLDLLAKTIRADVESEFMAANRVRLAITHLDQVADNPVRFVRKGQMLQAGWTRLVEETIEEVGIKKALVSFGPMRRDVSKWGEF